MKTTSEIEDRIRYLLAKELERRVKKANERLPHRCIYNIRQPLDTRRTVEDEPNRFYNRITMGVDPEGRPIPVSQTIGLCTYKDYSVDSDGQPLLTLCEDPIDAQRCPVFSPRLTKKMLWDEFVSQIQDLEWLEANLPEVYGLYWAINRTATVKVPWWARLLYRLLRIRPEPLRRSDDLMKLLPPVV